MKKSIGSMFLLFVLLTALVVSGCAPAPTPEPTSTPVPPTSTYTPIPPTKTPIPPTETLVPTVVTSTKITTSLGDVIITKAEIVSEDMFGSKAAPGYQILYVWFKSADGSTIDGGKFLDASEGVYVIGDDGSKTERYLGGLMSGSLMIGFTPPVSAKEFTLYWGDNDPIKLSLSQ
jgi:hypothetical protein